MSIAGLSSGELAGWMRGCLQSVLLLLPVPGMQMSAKLVY
jgi:hypothetical protein